MAHNAAMPALPTSSEPVDMTHEGAVMVATICVLTFLAVVCVCLRIGTRTVNHVIGVDDWLLLISLVLLFLQDGLNIAAAANGVGIPQEELMIHSLDSLKNFLKVLYAAEYGYSALTCTIKASILMSYRRVFKQDRIIAIAIWVLLGLSTAWFLATLFGFAFQCKPAQYAYDPFDYEGECFDLKAFTWGTGVANFVIDWLILCLPVWPVLKLQMGAVQKGLALSAFLLGSLACIASTVRAVLISHLDATDVTGSGTSEMTWTVVEPSCGIISACLPFLAGLFGRKLSSTVRNLSRKAAGFSSRSKVSERSGNSSRQWTGSHKGTTVVASREFGSHGGDFEMGGYQGRYEVLEDGRESAKNLVP